MVLKNNNLILGLDIGSHKTKAILCEIDAQKNLCIKAINSALTKGLLQGEIINPTELKNVINRIIYKFGYQNLGGINQVITNIPPYKTVFQKRSGVCSINNLMSLVSKSEVNKCIEKAKNSCHFNDKTIMHVLPFSARIDKKIVDEPLLQKGHNLEIETNLICTDKKNLLELKTVLNQLNLEIIGIIYDPLASAEVTLPLKEREQGVFLLDFGAKFSKIVFYQKNKLINTKLINIGGETVTNDIAKCLSVSKPEAERLKLIYGDLVFSRVNSNEDIEINTYEGRKSIKRILLCKIIEARINELVKILMDKFPEIFQDYFLYLIGSSCKLKGFSNFLNKKLNKKIIMEIPATINTVISDRDFLTALGLIIYGYKNKAFVYNEPIKKRTILNVKLPAY